MTFKEAGPLMKNCNRNNLPMPKSDLVNPEEEQIPTKISMSFRLKV